MIFLIPQKVVFFLLLTFEVTYAVSIAELRHNPFYYTEISAESRNKQPTRKSPIVSKVIWQPLLQATIVAGDLSVANVEGKVIRIGQKFDGYTLIKVGSKTAIFERDETQVVLRIKPKRK